MTQKVAYVMFAGDDDVSDVIFAENAEAALATAKEGGFTPDSYARVETLDKYFPGPVPGIVLLEELDLEIPCANCSTLVNNDYWDYRKNQPIRPVFQDDLCFCSARCCTEHGLKRLKKLH